MSQLSSSELAVVRRMLEEYRRYRIKKGVVQGGGLVAVEGIDGQKFAVDVAALAEQIGSTGWAPVLATTLISGLVGSSSGTPASGNVQFLGNKTKQITGGALGVLNNDSSYLGSFSVWAPSHFVLSYTGTATGGSDGPGPDSEIGVGWGQSSGQRRSQAKVFNYTGQEFVGGVLSVFVGYGMGYGQTVNSDPYWGAPTGVVGTRRLHQFVLSGPVARTSLDSAVIIPGLGEVGSQYAISARRYLYCGGWGFGSNGDVYAGGLWIQPGSPPPVSPPNVSPPPGVPPTTVPPPPTTISPPPTTVPPPPPPPGEEWETELIGPKLVSPPPAPIKVGALIAAAATGAKARTELGLATIAASASASDLTSGTVPAERTNFSTVAKSGTATVLTSEFNRIVKCDTTTFACGLTLGAATTEGSWLIIDDDALNAATNNITVTGGGGQTIDGGTLTINTNGGQNRIYFNGTNWRTY